MSRIPCSDYAKIFNKTAARISALGLSDSCKKDSAGIDCFTFRAIVDNANHKLYWVFTEDGGSDGLCKDVYKHYRAKLEQL